MPTKIIHLLFLILWIVLIPISSFSQTHFELTPGISISEVYDDNLYLANTDTKSDYITLVSPGFDFNILSRNSRLGLQYAPTFVWYNKEDQNDTTRHSGTLTFYQELSQHLSLDLSNNYLKTEEPYEETEGSEGARDTRQAYWWDTGQASLKYIFGRENAMSLGYRHTILENEDIALDDSSMKNPFASVTYWLNTKNGVESNFDYTEADFSRDDNLAPGDNYNGNSIKVEYLHRFTPQTTGSIGYGFTNRRFQGITQDYEVHDGSIGLDHAFSENLSLITKGGYFIQKNERSRDQDGYLYTFTLDKQFERGSFTLGGSGGWDENYISAERRGFTRYWQANIDLEYQVIEALHCYTGGFYGHNRDPENREWQNLEGNCGLRWVFLQWFSLALDYSYLERDDDIEDEDYKDNRVMLVLAANRLFRW